MAGTFTPNGDLLLSGDAAVTMVMKVGPNFDDMASDSADARFNPPRYTLQGHFGLTFHASTDPGQQPNVNIGVKVDQFNIPTFALLPFTSELETDRLAGSFHPQFFSDSTGTGVRIIASGTITGTLSVVTHIFGSSRVSSTRPASHTWIVSGNQLVVDPFPDFQPPQGIPQPEPSEHRIRRRQGDLVLSHAEPDGDAERADRHHRPQ